VWLALFLNLAFSTAHACPRFLAMGFPLFAKTKFQFDQGRGPACTLFLFISFPEALGYLSSNSKKGQKLCFHPEMLAQAEQTVWGYAVLVSVINVLFIQWIVLRRWTVPLSPSPLSVTRKKQKNRATEKRTRGIWRRKALPPFLLRAEWL